MKVIYSTRLGAGGTDSYISISTDGHVSEPEAVEFVLELVGRLMAYDRDRAERQRAASPTPAAGDGDA